jgi:hypothetical protein
VKLTNAEPRRLTQLSTITVVVIVLCVISIILLHLLQPAISPIRIPMSAYALGPYAPLFVFCVFCAPLIMASQAIGIHRSLQRPIIRSKLALIPAFIAGIAWLLVAVVHSHSLMDDTIAARIHSGAFRLAMLWMLIAMLRLSVHFRTDDGWRAFAAPSMVLASTALVIFVATFVALYTNYRTWVIPIFGALQRIMLALVLLWSFLAALHLRGIARYRAIGLSLGRIETGATGL